ncbi:MAG: hypothetical protein V9F00_09245 [Nocardioides sp.]
MVDLPAVSDPETEDFPHGQAVVGLGGVAPDQAVGCALGGVGTYVGGFAVAQVGVARHVAERVGAALGPGAEVGQRCEGHPR